MKKSVHNNKNTISTCKNAVNNTVNFENCSEFVRYDYEDKSKKKGSVLNLCYSENYIMRDIVNYLKESSDMKFYSESEREKYYGKPMYLSYIEYGVTDYWWIILAVNGYFNPYEFSGWETLIIPNENDIEKIMDKEMYVNPWLGVIPYKITETTPELSDIINGYKE